MTRITNNYIRAKYDIQKLKVEYVKNGITLLEDDEMVVERLKKIEENMRKFDNK